MFSIRRKKNPNVSVAQINLNGICNNMNLKFRNPKISTIKKLI